MKRLSFSCCNASARAWLSLRSALTVVAVAIGAGYALGDRGDAPKRITTSDAPIDRVVPSSTTRPTVRRTTTTTRARPTTTTSIGPGSTSTTIAPRVGIVAPPPAPTTLPTALLAAQAAIAKPFDRLVIEVLPYRHARQRGLRPRRPRGRGPH